MKEVDDRSTKFSVGTKTLKVFNYVVYKESATDYDHKKGLYHILYKDGDEDNFYHNEVRNLNSGTMK